MSIGIKQRYKFLGTGTVFVLVGSIAVQSLDMAQAQPLGYVQANCPNVVKQALDTVTAQCSKAGRGKVCYGNSSLTADLLPGANNTPFNAPGDTLDVSQVRQLTLGSMNTTANTWGIAELKIKADLPDSNPSQMVTLIMFGNTQLTDASVDANLAALTQTPGALARQNQYVTATVRAIDQQATKGASNAGATATKLAGLQATATARADTPTTTGTIPAYKATYAAATATRLAALQNTATAAPSATQVIAPVLGGPFKGLSAFYFQSTDSSPCNQAPHDGLLIQSPQGIKQRVTLSIDGATISLGSTVYITAQPSKFLTINTLEGNALVTAAGSTESAVAGTAVQVPLDASLHATGKPVLIDTTFYAADAIRSVPVRALPVPIVPVDGISAGAHVLNGSLTVLPNSIFSGACYNHFAYGYSDSIKVVIDDTLGKVWVQVYGGNFVLTKNAANSYSGTQAIAIYLGNVFDHYGSGNLSLTFSDPEHATGQVPVDFKDGCTITKAITIDASSDAKLTPTSAQAVIGTAITATPSQTLTKSPTFTPTPSRTKPPTATPTPSRTKPPTP